MNNEQAQQLLIKLDARYDWSQEVPPDFEYECEDRLLLLLKQDLEKRLGISLKLDIANIQDAYFYAQMDHSFGTGYADSRLVIRFSSFGRMCATWIEGQSPTNAREILDIVEHTVDARGYIFIPLEALDRAYDGRNKLSHSPGLTWWDRFFDYS